MKKITLDLTGERYGRLTVIREAERLYSKSGKMIRRWECLCDCGNVVVVRHGDLRSGRTLSCGCYNKAKESAVKKHGYSRTKLYKVYISMRQRCNNEKNKAYPYYGGRGIKVCDEWENDPQSFITWANKNGYQEGLTIDRINVDGDYCPKNCRWTDYEMQSINQKIRKDNKTGYKGIYLSDGVYRVQINRNKKRHYLGSFKTLEEAMNAREEAKAMIAEAKAEQESPTLFGEE